MNKVMIVSYPSLYIHIQDFLKSNLGYDILVTGNDQQGDLKSRKAWLFESLKSSGVVFKHRKDLKTCESIVTCGILDGLFLLLLNKCGIVKPRKIFWLSFFIHSPKVQKWLGFIIRKLLSSNVTIIVFSKCEIKMYQETMGIPVSAFAYLPYGNWNPQAESAPLKMGELPGTPINCEKYFFGGV